MSGGRRRRAGSRALAGALLGTVLVLLSAPPVRADEAPAPPAASPPAPQGPVETVEVREDADRTPALDATAFATLIRAEDFAGRVTSVTELLREQVGVQVRGFGGEYATVSIRGSTAEQVVVYLDGVPLNRALGGGVNLAELPLGQVESIEVYRGFTPAGLSAASIGGAILIHTRRPSGAAAKSVSMTLGSYGAAEGIASVSGTRGRADYTLGLEAAGSRGDFTFLDNNGTPDNPADDETARRVNNDSLKGHLTGQLALKTGARGRFRLSTDLLAGDQGVPGLDCCRSPGARYSSRRALVRPEWEIPGLLGGRLLARVAADYTASREEFDDRDGQIGNSGVSIDSLDRTAARGAETHLVLAVSARQALSFLASRRRESVTLEDRALGDLSDLGHAWRDTTVATLEDQIALRGDRLVLNPSLRYESYDSRFHPGDAGGVVMRPTADRSTTGKLGGRLRVTDDVTLKGNIGRFERLPDFTELFGSRGSVVGNPALRPERGRSADLGIVAARRRPKGTLRLVQVEASLFETVADDLIQFVPNSQSVVRAQNLNRSRIRGLELTLLLGLGTRFNGSLNLTHQTPRDTSGGTNDGNLLPGRPRDELSAGAALDVGRGRLFYEFTYVGSNFIDAPNTRSTALPARYLHDAGWRARLRPGLQATLEVKNITGERTYDYARFPLPGRSYDARLSWDF